MSHDLTRRRSIQNRSEHLLLTRLVTRNAPLDSGCVWIERARDKIVRVTIEPFGQHEIERSEVSGSCGVRKLLLPVRLDRCFEFLRDVIAVTFARQTILVRAPDRLLHRQPALE